MKQTKETTEHKKKIVNTRSKKVLDALAVFTVVGTAFVSVIGLLYATIEDSKNNREIREAYERAIDCDTLQYQNREVVDITEAEKREHTQSELENKIDQTRFLYNRKPEAILTFDGKLPSCITEEYTHFFDLPGGNTLEVTADKTRRTTFPVGNYGLTSTVIGFKVKDTTFLGAKKEKSWRSSFSDQHTRKNLGIYQQR